MQFLHFHNSSLLLLSFISRRIVLKFYASVRREIFLERDQFVSLSNLQSDFPEKSLKAAKRFYHSGRARKIVACRNACKETPGNWRIDRSRGRVHPLAIVDRGVLTQMDDTNNNGKGEKKSESAGDASPSTVHKILNATAFFSAGEGGQRREV